jgi:hypothetical protein
MGCSYKPRWRDRRVTARSTAYLCKLRCRWWTRSTNHRPQQATTAEVVTISSEEVIVEVVEYRPVYLNCVYHEEPVALSDYHLGWRFGDIYPNFVTITGTATCLFSRVAELLVSSAQRIRHVLRRSNGDRGNATCNVAGGWPRSKQAPMAQERFCNEDYALLWSEEGIAAAPWRAGPRNCAHADGGLARRREHVPSRHSSDWRTQKAVDKHSDR